MDKQGQDHISSAALAAAPDVPPRINRPSVVSRLKRLFGITGTTLARQTVPDPTALPWSAVVLLNFFQGSAFRGFGTGFFVRSDVVVTAGHSFRISQATAVGVYPAFDSQKNPSTNANGLAWAWDGGRDVGLIVTERHATGVLGLDAPAAAQARIAGYAFPYANNTPRMSFDDGPCRVTGARVEHDILVSPGDSGAPVFLPGGPRALGVHVRTERPPNQPRVVGVAEQANDDLERVLLNLEQIARSHIGNQP